MSWLRRCQLAQRTPAFSFNDLFGSRKPDWWDHQPKRICSLNTAPSGLNHLKCWVEALELDAGIGGCKAPVSFDIVGVAVEEPGGNLALEAAPVRDTPIETLIGQDSKLGLGHVEPAAVLGRVVPFEALDEAPCLQCRECLVE